MSIKDAMWDYLVGQTSVTALADLRVYQKVSPGFATGALRVTGVPTNNETVVIDGKTYTWKNTVTGGNDVDGYVLIGANVNASIDNMVAAINLDAGAGTTYADSTTAHNTVMASRPVSGYMETQALSISRSGDLDTTETMAAGSWGDTVMNVFPFIVITRTNANHLRSMDGGAGLAQASLQIQCVDENSVDAEAVADAVFALVHGLDGTTIGTPAVTIESMRVVSSEDVYDPPEHGNDVGLHRQILNVVTMHRESIPTPV